MPYIVTVKREDHIEGLGLECVGHSRRAVATLDKAREAARPIIEAAWPEGSVKLAASYDDADESTLRFHDAHADVDSLPESGGTIGPLPDGTVIEVLPVVWGWIIGCAEDL